AAVVVLRAGRVGVVEVRDASAGADGAGAGVRHEGADGSGARELGRHFVVEHVVLQAVGEHQRGGDVAGDAERAVDRVAVEGDVEILQLHAVIGGADDFGGLTVFCAADAADFLRAMHGGATVAGGGADDVHFPAALGEKGQRAGDL